MTRRSDPHRSPAALAAILALVAAPVLGAQRERAEPSTAAAGDSVHLAAGPEYRIGGPLGWLDKWLFGDRYRTLWTDTIVVRVADPAALGVSLAPLRADTLYGATQVVFGDGGGGGARYAFRLSDPRLTTILPADLRTDAVLGPLQDLVSGMHPGAPFVTTPLARAVGIEEVAATLTILPDDRALGPYRASFGGRLGYLRAEGAAGAGAIDTDSLSARLDAGDATAVDARAFLRARLFDLLIGNAHLVPGAQRWTRTSTPAGETWAPLPSPKELAFARFDGLVARLARASVPMLNVFGGKYPDGLGETEYQLAVDRRFLGALERPAWDSVVQSMQSQLTDAVIDSAVALLPAPWAARSSASLARALKARRTRLPQAAHALYAMLAETPDVYVPATADSVRVSREETGMLDVAAPPAFHRTFIAHETKEVRLFLAGGRPAIVVRGAAYGGPPLRIVTNGARPFVIDSSRSVARVLTVNDSAGGATIDARAAGLPPSVTTAPFARPSFAPEGSSSLVKPAEDARYGPIVWLGAFGNYGLLIGAGVERIGYEGEYAPYRNRQWIRAGYATSPDEYAVQYHGDFRFQHGAFRLYVDAERSGLTLLDFYGLGNATPDTGSKGYYASRQVVYAIQPSLVWHLTKHDTIAAGILYKNVETDTTVNNFINHERPFGWPAFQEFGLRVAYAHDTRDAPVAPRSGFLFAASGKYYPAVLDAPSPFGGLAGVLSGYWTPDASQRFTLAARAGGEKIWGDFPAFEAAFIGGEYTVGGLRPQRYAGDASAFGNLEARWRLAPLPFVLRWDFGVSGIVDVGRVFVTGESSRAWHTGVGGGIWAVLPDRSLGGFLTVMVAEGNVVGYLGTQFRY